MRMFLQRRSDDKAGSEVLTPAQAISRYENAVEREPNAANYLQLGVAYYIAHQWNDALRAFEKTIELDPNQAYAYYYLGVLYAAKGERAKADAALQKLLQVSTNEMLKDQARARIPAIHSPAQLGAPS